MSDESYNPIPEPVWQTWRAFCAASVAAGFSWPSICLHTRDKIDSGDDVHVDGVGVVRYWPECGGGGIDGLVLASVPGYGAYGHVSESPEVGE